MGSRWRQCHHAARLRGTPDIVTAPPLARLVAGRSTVTITARAEYELGLCYELGIGVQVTFASAEQRYLSAAALNPAFEEASLRGHNLATRPDRDATHVGPTLYDKFERSDKPPE